MEEEELEARVRIGDYNEGRCLLIEVKDVIDGQYNVSTAYPIKYLNKEETIQKFVSELEHIDDLCFTIHYK